jgi:hypothetical protein
VGEWRIAVARRVKHRQPCTVGDIWKDLNQFLCLLFFFIRAENPYAITRCPEVNRVTFWPTCTMVPTTLWLGIACRGYIDVLCQSHYKAREERTSGFRHTGPEIWDVPGRKSANREVVLGLTVAILLMRWQNAV